MKTYLFSLLLTICLFSCNSDNNKASEKQDTAQSAAHTPSQSATQASNKKQNKHLNTGGMQWITMEEAEKIDNPGNKKYLIDIYTEWCGWCKVMDKKTFSDPEVQAYLKDNFIMVKFDAEQREAIQFKGKEYKWQSGGRRGVNTLAMELLGNRMSYPTLVYLDENLNKIRSSPGFKNPSQLIGELKVINRS